MKKVTLLMLLGIMLMGAWAQSANAVVFETPAGLVNVSGAKDGSGIIYANSDNPAALKDFKNGLTQYCHDGIRDAGQCNFNNVFIAATVVSDTQVQYQLYQPTMEFQYAFNFLNADGLWGPIPNCNIRADGKTVLVQHGTPDADGHGGGGYLVYIAHLKDAGPFEVVPQGGQGCGQVTKRVAAPTQFGVVTTPVAKKKLPCDPCEKIAEVKKDTAEILVVTKAIHSSVGTLGKSGKSVQEKLGEPTKKDETVFSDLNDIKQQVTPGFWDNWKWWLVILLLIIVLIYIIGIRMRLDQQNRR